MSTFLRYFLKELSIHTTLFFITFLVLFTLIIGTLSLKKILEFNPDYISVFKGYYLTSLQLLSFLIPISAFLGILFTLQRMREEKEILALFSFGYTFKDFWKPILIFTTIILGINFLSHFYILPLAKRIQKLEKIKLTESQAKKPIIPKQPVPISKDLYIYVGEAKFQDNKNLLKKVIFLEKKAPSTQGLYLAEEVILDYSSGTLDLKRGWKFTLENKNIIEVLKFQEYSMLIQRENQKSKIISLNRGEMTLDELRGEIQKLSPQDIRYHRYLSEYYIRFFYPFVTIPLLLQGFILGIYLPTSSRVVLFIVGLSFYVAFYLGYNFFISLSEIGKIQPLVAQGTFLLGFSLLALIEYKLLKQKGIPF